MTADLGVLVAILGAAGLAAVAGYCFGYNRGQDAAWSVREDIDPDPGRVPLKRVA